MPIELRQGLGLFAAACLLWGTAMVLHAAATTSKTDASAVAVVQDDSALRASEGKFDANGEIRCTEYAGEPLHECEFGVARAGGGDATVVITKPDGDPRIVSFRLGQAVGVNAGQSGGDPEFSAEKKDGVTVLRIGDERYEIPDSVIM